MSDIDNVEGQWMTKVKVSVKSGMKWERLWGKNDKNYDYK